MRNLGLNRNQTEVGKNAAPMLAYQVPVRNNYTYFAYTPVIASNSGSLVYN